MRLHLTATSERGKSVTKTGNDYIKIGIVNEDRKPLFNIVVNYKSETMEIFTHFEPMNCQEYKLLNGKALVIANSLRSYVTGSDFGKPQPKTQGNITCECGAKFYGWEDKEDTCPKCLKELIQPKTAIKVPCMNCGSMQNKKDINYLGDSLWNCPNCKE